MQETVLEIRGAQKRFGATEALRGVDLTLRRREWLGLLGPNGAGKTTLVRTISGLCRLDSGSIRLFETSVTDRGPAAVDARRRLGVVPQEIALYPLLTARENLQTFATLSGLNGSRRDERVDWALEMTGLADRADSRVKTYSGGMKRRLNIACSVMHEPEVILLDEPTAGVDPQSRQRIWEMLSELQSRGASLLLTTHQLDEAQEVCGRIVIIDQGRVIASGTLDELIAATVGGERRLTLRLDRSVEPRALGRAVEIERQSVSCSVDDVATALPGLIQELQGLGARIEDVRVESPTLQSVFIHLTGRELRE